MIGQNTSLILQCFLSAIRRQQRQSIGRQTPEHVEEYNLRKKGNLHSPFSETTAKDLWNAGKAALLHGAAVRREPRLCPICLSIASSCLCSPPLLNQQLVKTLDFLFQIVLSTHDAAFLQKLWPKGSNISDASVAY